MDTRIRCLGNQFRSLEEDEVIFLDSLRRKQLEEERKREHEDGEELKHFRKYGHTLCASYTSN